MFVWETHVTLAEAEKGCHGVPCRYGFPSSEKGIEEMEAALQFLEEDGDIYVLRLAGRSVRQRQQVHCAVSPSNSIRFSLPVLALEVNKVAIEEALFGPFEDRELQGGT